MSYNLHQHNFQSLSVQVTVEEVDAWRDYADKMAKIINCFSIVNVGNGDFKIQSKAILNTEELKKLTDAMERSEAATKSFKEGTGLNHYLDNLDEYIHTDNLIYTLVHER